MMDKLPMNDVNYGVVGDGAGKRHGRTRRAVRFSALRRRWSRNQSGTAAIEFAFVAPLMLTILIGIVDVSNAVSLNWRMVQLNRTLADLASQNANLTTAQLDNIFMASASVMSPLNGPLPKMLISSVIIGNDKIARVCWSEGREDGQPSGLLKSASGLAKGSVVPLPNLDLAVPKSSLIVTTTTMTYQGMLSPNFNMSSKSFYFRPRNGNKDIVGLEQVERVGQPLCNVP